MKLISICLVLLSVASVRAESLQHSGQGLLSTDASSRWDPSHTPSKYHRAGVSSFGSAVNSNSNPFRDDEFSDAQEEFDDDAQEEFNDAEQEFADPSSDNSVASTETKQSLHSRFSRMKGIGAFKKWRHSPVSYDDLLEDLPQPEPQADQGALPLPQQAAASRWSRFKHHSNPKNWRRAPASADMPQEMSPEPSQNEIVPEPMGTADETVPEALTQETHKEHTPSRWSRFNPSSWRQHSTGFWKKEQGRLRGMLIKLHEKYMRLKERLQSVTRHLLRRQPKE